MIHITDERIARMISDKQMIAEMELRIETTLYQTGFDASANGIQKHFKEIYYTIDSFINLQKELLK